MQPSNQLSTICPDELVFAFTKFQSNGVFTPVLRELFIMKRSQLHISHARLAHLFNVSPQSVWNWERGITRHCGKRSRIAMLRFLGGYFDNLFTRPGGFVDGRVAHTSIQENITAFKHEQFQQMLLETTRLYQLVEHRVDLRDSILRQLRKICLNTMKALSSEQLRVEQVAETPDEYKTKTP